MSIKPYGHPQGQSLRARKAIGFGQVMYVADFPGSMGKTD